MVEKGVAWRETQGFADAGDSGRESTLRRIKGVQFSVSAAAGVSYNFNRHIGLYVEPDTISGRKTSRQATVPSIRPVFPSR